VQPAILDKLRATVGAPHLLTGVDLSPYVVDGRTPVAAVFPGSVDEVVGIVRLAAEAEVPLLPWGGGTAITVGLPPPRPVIVLGLRRLAGVVEHEPGDLTATVQAGTTMATLQATLAVRGQWLSLDPPDAERATVGGVVAADASGPRRHLYGTARDLVIGVTVVTAAGEVVRGGGKVVKNVAGYDLPKLFIGSYGTLGILVDITVKLRPRPDAERLVALRFDRLKDAGAAARALGASDLVPNAVDVLDGVAARVLGAAGAAVLVVGFDGLAEQVDWQCAELQRVAGPLGGRELPPLAPDAWVRLATAARDAAGTPAALMRFSVLPTLVAELMEQGAAAARQRGLSSAWAAHAGVGIVSGALLSESDAQDPAPMAAAVAEWRSIARAGAGHAMLEWAPLAVKALVPVWDDPGAAGRIMQAIKTKLDPGNVLNPGRLVGGI
jgi:glycolate oxidase FAD binding subunit